MNNFKITTDEQLIKLFCEGNNIAFESIYVRYYSKLFYYILHTTGNTEVTKDILQDVFIKVVENKCRFNIEKRFSVWIYTIANNMCKNYFNHNKIIKKAEKELLYSQSSIISDKDDKVERKIILKESISKLDYKQKQVFILKTSFAFSYKEISEILKISEGTAKSRMFNAIKKIKNQIDKKNN